MLQPNLLPIQSWGGSAFLIEFSYILVTYVLPNMQKEASARISDILYQTSFDQI